MLDAWIERIGIISCVALPLFNIPLILRLLRRKSSKDFSLSWALGVWVCIIFMTPQSLRSTDAAFRVFGVFNVIFFSAVTFLIVKYRNGNGIKGSAE
jgi:hypothetical protein